MRLPRFRLTIRWLVALVAFAAVGLGGYVAGARTRVIAVGPGGKLLIGGPVEVDQRPDGSTMVLVAGPPSWPVFGPSCAGLLIVVAASAAAAGWTAASRRKGPGRASTPRGPAGPSP